MYTQNEEKLLTIKKDELVNETDCEECSVGHLSNLTGHVIKTSTVCLLLFEEDSSANLVYLSTSLKLSNVLSSSSSQRFC